MIGQTVLRYKILAKLGQGGMGVVYKVRDLTTGWEALPARDTMLKVEAAAERAVEHDFEEAIDQSRLLIEVEPLWAFGYYVLGCCLATQGKAAEALECIHRAIELDGRGVWRRRSKSDRRRCCFI